MGENIIEIRWRGEQPEEVDLDTLDSDSLIDLASEITLEKALAGLLAHRAISRKPRCFPLRKRTSAFSRFTSHGLRL